MNRREPRRIGPIARLTFRMGQNTDDFDPDKCWEDTEFEYSTADSLDDFIGRVEEEVSKKMIGHVTFTRSLTKQRSGQDFEEMWDVRPSLLLKFCTFVHSVEDDEDNIPLDSHEEYVARTTTVADLFKEPQCLDGLKQLHAMAQIDVTILDAPGHEDDVQPVRQPSKPSVYVHIADNKNQTETKEGNIVTKHVGLAMLDHGAKNFMGLYQTFY